MINKDRELINRIVSNIETAVIGKREVILNLIKGIIAGGHILIEDVPGVGKTTMVKAIAKSLNLTYKRIQFTPDLLPSDITGVSIYNQRNCEFEFREGPVFSNILLADEINRTSPKTQAALLEVMEELQVSEGNITYKLETPFCVLATQNPIDHEGTFNLPEAQLDRFMIKIKMGYPNNQDESRIIELYASNDPMHDIRSVINREDVLYLQDRVRGIFASREISDYIVRIVDATRNNKYINLGASTRAALALVRISQAAALIDGREYIVPEDVKSNALMVLNHRIVLNSEAKLNNINSCNIIENIIGEIPVPKL
ncbi:MAG: MoxR family ATPase [Bacillota bacterium]|nr:MoxR family ATPase [Bacillota bacterium]